LLSSLINTCNFYLESSLFSAKGGAIVDGWNRREQTRLRLKRTGVPHGERPVASTADPKLQHETNNCQHDFAAFKLYLEGSTA